jgi:hypothetical protein
MSLKNVYVDLPKDTFQHGLNLQSSDIVVKSSQLFNLPILNFNLSLSSSWMLRVLFISCLTLLHGFLLNMAIDKRNLEDHILLIFYNG